MCVFVFCNLSLCVLNKQFNDTCTYNVHTFECAQATKNHSKPLRIYVCYVYVLITTICQELYAGCDCVWYRMLLQYSGYELTSLRSRNWLSNFFHLFDSFRFGGTVERPSFSFDVWKNAANTTPSRVMSNTQHWMGKQLLIANTRRNQTTTTRKYYFKIFVWRTFHVRFTDSSPLQNAL